MVSKKVHCAYCQKKCSGNVLRYQDQYYHKQCFELEQQQQQQQHQQELKSSESPVTTISPSPATSEGVESLRDQTNEVLRSRNLNATTTTTTTTTSQHVSSPTHPGTIMSASNGRPAGQRTPTPSGGNQQQQQRAATLPHSISSPANGFDAPSKQQQQQQLRGRTLDNRSSTTTTTCAGCREKILDGQALIALDAHWHVWCFKCSQCRAPLHGEYVAKGGRAYCEKDYQKLYGITCVYCKRYITGKVLQAGEAHHFHPSCARCSKCGDPFVPGEEMYLQGEVTWHPRCGPGPSGAESSLMEASQTLRNPRAHSPSELSAGESRSASPFSYMSRQYGGRASPAYADSEALGDLSRVYTISYLNADPNQGYLRRPLEPSAPKSPQFSRPTSLSRIGGGGGAPSDRSRCSSRSTGQYVYSSASHLGAPPSQARERSIPRGMYSVLSGMRGGGGGGSSTAGGGGASSRARSPSMMNEEAIQLAAYPSGQKPAPNSLAAVERDDFPAPPFPYPQHAHSRAHSASATSRAVRSQHNGNGGAETSIKQAHQERTSRPRSREITNLDKQQLRNGGDGGGGVDSDGGDSISSQNGEDSSHRFRKEEEELSKIANGIGKIFLQTLKEREKLRAWKRSNLDPRNASRTPSATRELSTRPLRYENPLNASPSRDIDRPRPMWTDSEQVDASGSDLQQQQQTGEVSPTRTRSSLGASRQLNANATATTNSPAYGYKVVQSNRSTPKPGYGCTSGPYTPAAVSSSSMMSGLSFAEQQRVASSRAADLLGRQRNGGAATSEFGWGTTTAAAAAAVTKLPDLTAASARSSTRSLASAAHFRRSMPNVFAGSVANHHQHLEGPPKLYPYHLLATSNYRLPPDVDRCHLERHLSNEEFQYIFHCDRLDFYRLPEWKRNELKRRARLF